jgi:hypothetical protein
MNDPEFRNDPKVSGNVTDCPEFTRLPRSGDTAYGLLVGVYPTDFPTAPGPGVDG